MAGIQSEEDDDKRKRSEEHGVDNFGFWSAYTTFCRDLTSANSLTLVGRACLP